MIESQRGKVERERERTSAEEIEFFMRRAAAYVLLRVLELWREPGCHVCEGLTATREGVIRGSRLAQGSDERGAEERRGEKRQTDQQEEDILYDSSEVVQTSGACCSECLKTISE